MLVRYELKGCVRAEGKAYQIVRVEDQTRRTEIAVFDGYTTAVSVIVDLIKALHKIGKPV